MLRGYAGGLAAILLTAGALDAQLASQSDSVIRHAEEEGRRIAEYDNAVHQATEALLAARPEQHRISLYVARQQDARWHVFFGSINIVSSEFTTAYEVTQEEPDGDRYVVSRLTGREPADPELSRAATALVTALGAFEPKWERYQTYVWRDFRGRWVTYFLPGPTAEGQWPIGADMRVLVSFDGQRILEATTFHADLTVVEPSREAAIATHHRHLAGENPAPTDFAYVLITPQLAPMALVASDYTCTVTRQGRMGPCRPSEEK
ncbi:MAG: hypothetical protein ACE5JR_08930 [Gemmatimonadota bacterium]